jgi:hypothetical protein
MKKTFTFIFSVFAFLIVQAQVSISTDFTDQTKEKEELHNIWRVANRISPENGVVVRNGVDVNTVRMIGGINKTVNGKRVPDYDYDPVRYDSVNNKYVYNFTALLSRINTIRNSNTKLFQIVLDQPSWAFQHGYTFILNGQSYNGTDFKESERITTYGNSLPPKDRVAFRDFVKAMVKELVDNYGEAEVVSWRFRVGSEIETPDHWRGTKQDFIAHFQDIEQSVRAILPDAKIGLHTREPNFFYKNGSETNYKGEPFASFADGLIEYCFNNNLRYDFWGISDYIIVNNSRSLKLSEKFDQLFAPLTNHPKWNTNAKLDVMEYAPIISIAPPEEDGGSFLRAATTHAELVDLTFSHMFYKNQNKGLDQIYRWGIRTGRNEGVIAVVNNMVGKKRYETTVSGTPKVSSNKLDAIFAKGDANNKFDVLVYSYNDSSLNYRDSEAVEVSFNLEVPVGTKIYYRNALYGKEQNKFQAFLENEPASGWIKNRWDRKGTPERVLNAAGLAAWAVYDHKTPYTFSKWINIITEARVTSGSGSMITLSTEIPSFGYRKFEFQIEPDFVQELSPAKVIWTTTEDFQPFKPASAGMVIDTENDLLTLNFVESGWGFPMAEITNLKINSDNYDTLRLRARNTTDNVGIQMVANVPGQDFSSARKVVNIPLNQGFENFEIDISDWGLWQGIINQFKIYSRTKTGSLIIDSIEFVPRTDATVLNVTLTQEGEGLLNYKSGTCFAGRELKLLAIPDEGWEFAGWTGAIVSMDNPIDITVETDLNIKATFSKVLSINDVIFNKKTTVFPNPSETGIFRLSSEEIWEVYAISGVKILSGKGNQIDLSNFKQGIYLLKTENKSFKLLKL